MENFGIIVLFLGVCVFMGWVAYKGYVLTQKENSKRAAYFRHQRIEEGKEIVSHFQKNSYVEELAGLKKMKDEGVLSEQEFEQAKAKVLAK